MSGLCVPYSCKNQPVPFLSTSRPFQIAQKRIFLCPFDIKLISLSVTCVNTSKITLFYYVYCEITALCCRKCEIILCSSPNNFYIMTLISQQSFIVEVIVPFMSLCLGIMPTTMTWQSHVIICCWVCWPKPGPQEDLKIRRGGDKQ